MTSRDLHTIVTCWPPITRRRFGGVCVRIQSESAIARRQLGGERALRRVRRWTAHRPHMDSARRRGGGSPTTVAALIPFTWAITAAALARAARSRSLKPPHVTVAGWRRRGRGRSAPPGDRTEGDAACRRRESPARLVPKTKTSPRRWGAYTDLTPTEFRSPLPAAFGRIEATAIAFIFARHYLRPSVALTPQR